MTSPEAVAKEIRGWETSSVVVGTDHGLLWHLPLPVQEVYEPKHYLWEMVNKAADLSKIHLYAGMLSSRHRWIHMNLPKGDLEPYDIRFRFEKPYIHLVPGLPFFDLFRPKILVVGDWRYLCFLETYDRPLLATFTHVFVLDPHGEYHCHTVCRKKLDLVSQ